MEYFAIELSSLMQRKKVRVLINNKPILIAYTEKGIYAIRDKCPHMGSTLSNGVFKDGIITCKDHGLPISVETGEVTDINKAEFLNLDEYNRSVSKYKTIIRDGSVYINI